jgi:hypothetical protein
MMQIIRNKVILSYYYSVRKNVKILKNAGFANLDAEHDKAGNVHVGDLWFPEVSREPCCTHIPEKPVKSSNQCCGSGSLGSVCFWTPRSTFKK